ncbi:MAG: hypothetical protein A4E43_00443 [Methanosaeta sp. PtaB.Bin005]|nr:MAG: hypothetical protein A4E43_00443 [Methanosaeta sp. PtaB.Bin005]
MFRSGRARRSWAIRRMLDVPTRAPWSSSSMLLTDFSLHKRTSYGESRFRTAETISSSGLLVGRSFMLCTARSILPESMRSSISATKTPKPVSWWRGLSRKTSPLVLTRHSWVWMPRPFSLSCTICVWRNARGLPLVPTISFSGRSGTPPGWSRSHLGYALQK